MLWKLSHNYRGEKKVLWNDFHPWMPSIKKQCLSQTLAALKLSVHFVWVSLFCLSVVSTSLWPHGLQDARFRCPSLSPRVCSHSCPLSQWCHPIISSSVVPFFCLKSFAASQSFLMSQVSHQVAKVLELRPQHQSLQWIFRVDFLWDWLIDLPAV